MRVSACKYRYTETERYSENTRRVTIYRCRHPDGGIDGDMYRNCPYDGRSSIQKCNLDGIKG